MTASTVTVAHIRPSWSIPPITGDSAVIWTVAAEEAGTKDPPADDGLVEDEVSSKETGVQIRVDR